MRLVKHVQQFARSESRAVISRSIATQMAGYGLSLVLTPVAIAFYTPTDFGKFVVVMFGANVLATYGGLKLEWALINERSGQIAGVLLRFCYTLMLGWGAVATLAVLFSPNVLFDRLPVGRLGWGLAVPVIMASGYALVLQSWGIRMQSYKDVYFARNSVMVMRQVLQIGLGIAWPSVLTLLAAEFLARLVGVGLILKRLEVHVRLLLPRRFMRLFRAFVGRRYAHFTKVALPSTLLDYAMAEGVAVIIVPLFGLRVAGAYWLVQRLFGVPLAVIGKVVADVLQGQLARRREDGEIWLLTRQAGLFLAGVAVTVLPVGVAVFWLATQYLYAGKWALSGQIALMVLPAICAQFAASPLSRVLIVLEMMTYKYLFDGAMLIGLVAWVVLTRLCQLGPMRSVVVLASIQAAAYGLYLAVSLYVARVGKAGPRKTQAKAHRCELKPEN